jgi:hypothetical protein
MHVEFKNRNDNIKSKDKSNVLNNISEKILEKQDIK